MKKKTIIYITIVLTVFLVIVFYKDDMQGFERKNVEFMSLSRVLSGSSDEVTLYIKNDLAYIDIREFRELLPFTQRYYSRIKVEEGIAKLKTTFSKDQKNWLDRVGLSPDSDLNYFTATFNFIDNTYSYYPVFNSYRISYPGNYMGNVRSYGSLNSGQRQSIIFDKYGIDSYIIKDTFEKRYLVQLNVLNHLLTGSSYDIIYNGNKIYGFAGAQFKYDSILNRVYDSANINESNINEEFLYSYLLFIFDQYYGLKNYYGVEVITDLEFVNELKSEFTEEKHSNESLNNFIYKFDDLHTRVYKYGFYTNSPKKPKDFPESLSKTKQFHTRRNSLELICNEETITSEVVNEIPIISINNFTDKKIYELFLLELEKYPDYDSIVLDLRCNTGGYIGYMVQALSAISHKTIQYNFYDVTKDFNSKFTATLINNRRIKKDFYIATSKMTYSAGNLFTSTVKDHSLGIIVGEKTSGGGCYVDTTVLPDGTIINFSGPEMILNIHREEIESGIEPDILVEDVTSIEEIVKAVKKDIDRKKKDN